MKSGTATKTRRAVTAATPPEAPAEPAAPAEPVADAPTDPMPTSGMVCLLLADDTVKALQTAFQIGRAHV